MSTIYGAGPGNGGYAPPRKVNFGWIGEAWQFFTKAAGIWIVAVLIYGAMQWVISFVLQSVMHPYSGGYTPYGGTPGVRSPLDVFRLMSPAYFSVSTFIGIAFSAFQNASLFRMGVKQVRGEELSFADIFGGGAYFVPMLIFNVIYTIATWVGILLLIVGVFVVGGLLLAAPAMVADGESPMTAISRSFEAMKSDGLNAFLFVLVYVLLCFVSVIPCGLGVFVTVPMLYIISALAYRDMAGMPMPPSSDPYGGVAQPGVWPPTPSSGSSFGQPPSGPPSV